MKNSFINVTEVKTANNTNNIQEKQNFTNEAGQSSIFDQNQDTHKSFIDAEMMDEVDELPKAVNDSKFDTNSMNKNIKTSRSPKENTLSKNSSFEKSFSDAMKAFYKKKQNANQNLKRFSNSSRRLMNYSKRSINRSSTFTVSVKIIGTKSQKNWNRKSKKMKQKVKKIGTESQKNWNRKSKKLEQKVKKLEQKVKKNETESQKNWN